MTNDNGDEIIAEDWPTYYTQVPVWVLLAEVPAQAYRMYAFLAEHINTRTPGRRISCPKQTAIARALGLKNPRQVAPYAQALEQLGAVRIEEYRYQNGMRRGYRYHVRFNPPAGYDGLVALSQFYESNPDLKSATSKGRVSAGLAGSKEEPTGQSGGTKNSTSGGTKNGTARGATDSTAERDQDERDQDERDGAPSARSASDVRRTATSGSRSSSTGGSAASGKTKPSSLTREQRQQVAAFAEALPKPLADLWPANPPGNLKRAVLEALAVDKPQERTAQQLVDFRLMPKWNKHYASRDAAGPIEKPVGVLITILHWDHECQDARCDERTNVDSGQSCTACEMRAVDRRADRERERQQEDAPVATPTLQPVRPVEPAGASVLPAGGSGGDWAPPNDEYRAVRALATGQRRHR